MTDLFYFINNKLVSTYLIVWRKLNELWKLQRKTFYNNFMITWNIYIKIIMMFVICQDVIIKWKKNIYSNLYILSYYIILSFLEWKPKYIDLPTCFIFTYNNIYQFRKYFYKLCNILINLQHLLSPVFCCFIFRSEGITIHLNKRIRSHQQIKMILWETTS